MDTIVLRVRFLGGFENPDGFLEELFADESRSFGKEARERVGVHSKCLLAIWLALFRVVHLKRVVSADAPASFRMMDFLRGKGKITSV